MYYRFQFLVNCIPYITKRVTIFVEEYEEASDHFNRVELCHVRDRSEAYSFAIRYARTHKIRHIFFDDQLGEE